MKVILVMKKVTKIILLGILIILSAFFLSFGNTQYSIKKYDQLLKIYQPIYDVIKTEDGYSTAEVKGKKVIFYDENHKEIKSLTLEKEFSGKLLFIEKRSDSVIFWNSGWLDDTSGIMFLEGDWTDATWNGLVRITRLLGNAYEVHTFR